MSDKMEIKNPIEIKDNTVERIALELMIKISDSESISDKEKYKKPNVREYYLKLYNQCHKVVDNRNIKLDDLFKD